ncbi:MAG: hypothetical protein Q8O30_13435 [Candidatus Omnitrophota bacterium]|nr:hypothetical protein [Candidatus Omnitrophota bacterium]
MKYSDLTIDLAGISISFRAEASKNALREDKLCSQAIDCNRPNALFRERYSCFSDIDTTGFTLRVATHLWTLHENHNTKIFTLNPTSRSGKIMAVLNDSMTKGEIYLWRKEDDWLGTRLGRIIMDNLVARSKKFMFHACGIRDGRDGYLFLGKSGAGKTTIARLWLKKNAETIDDDRIIVYKEKEGFAISSGGIFKKNSCHNYSAPRKVLLKRIFFLNHGMKNKVVTRDCRDMLEAMLKGSLTLDWDKKVLRDMFCFYLDLAVNVKGCDLEFVQDDTCVDFIRQNL